MEERRQILYAALLRYFPETGSLRERYLDALVLAGLADSSESGPMRIGAIQQNITSYFECPTLRPVVIKDTVDRLMKMKKVGQTAARKRAAYYLEESGRNDITHVSTSTASLFEPVLAKMLENTNHLCTREQGEKVCRRFVSECFARFGQQIAKSVCGALSPEKLLEMVDISAAYYAAIQNVALNGEALHSLETRCRAFLRSNAPEDIELKFRLTQGYYVAQLLGYDSTLFNPIADEAFRGCIFYIDTNIILAQLLSNDTAPLFDEVVNIANRLGIELRVTRATIDETRTAATNHISDMKTVLANVPSVLIEKTSDEFLESFLMLRQSNPKITPDEFLSHFDDIQQILRGLGITITEHTVESIAGIHNITETRKIINEAAEKTRGWGKSEAVQIHDACHYHLVCDERSAGKKCWFLTRDRTLFHAAAKFDGGLPFCFGIIEFLQSLSPFVVGSREEKSLVDLFSASLERDITFLPREHFFDLQEMKLIGELHADVLSTPPEQLILAFDFVKSNILDGKPYRQEHHTKVALELKKFISSSSDEKQEALQAETTRLQGIVLDERKKRESAEKIALEEKERTEQLKAEVIAVKREHEDSLTREEAHKRAEKCYKIIFMTLSSLIAVGIWRFDNELVVWINSIFTGLGAYGKETRLVVRAIGSIVLIGAVLPIILFLKPKFRIGLLALVSAISLAGLDILGQEKVTQYAAYLAIGTTISLLLLIIHDMIKNRSSKD